MRNSNRYNALRSNPVQIAEWMEALLPKNLVSKDTAVVTLAERLGISRTRTVQFLNLMRIRVDSRGRLKGMADLTESKLRSVIQMNPTNQRAALQRMLGPEVLSKAG